MGNDNIFREAGAENSKRFGRVHARELQGKAHLITSARGMRAVT